MNPSIIVAIAVWAGVAAAAYALLGFVFAEDRVVSRRLRGMTDYEQAQALEAQPFLKSFRARIGTPVVESIRHLSESFGPTNYRAHTRQRLARAGDPGHISADAWTAIKLGCALGLCAVFTMAGVVGFYALRLVLLVGPAALIGGWFLPEVYLRNVREHRQDDLRRQLPDMLDMLTISVEAGLGFDQALAKYVKNTDNALSLEFGRVLQEVQTGVPRREALRRLALRTDVPELNAFISAMIQADMLGTSVASVLRAQAHEMRLKRRQYAEEKAQQLPVKMIFPVVLCIMPATLIVVIGPAVIQIVRLFASGM